LIAVVDYGMGNLRSVAKALEKVGADAVVTSDAGVIADSTGMVLPGVGAFADCMKNLDRFHLTRPIIDFIDTGRPFFGICLGLQLLFTEGFEFGRHEGLGVIKGSVVRFSGPPFDGKDRLKIPHMGWNRVRWNTLDPPFDAVGDSDYFYFVHSYYVVPEDPDTTAGITDYGIPFVSALKKDNIFATQFHPEKSQQKGLSILKSFAALVDRWDS
jgi:imidazole glycerol-phosphate synthase subunit HisH